MLVLSVLSQQSKQKEQSSLHATCSLFSVDQLQPRTEGKEGRQRMSVAQGQRDREKKRKGKEGKGKGKGK